MVSWAFGTGAVGRGLRNACCGCSLGFGLGVVGLGFRI